MLHKIVMKGIVLQLVWLAMIGIVAVDQSQAETSAVNSAVSGMSIADEGGFLEPADIGVTGWSPDASMVLHCDVPENGTAGLFSICASLPVNFVKMGFLHFAHFIRPPPVLSV